MKKKILLSLVACFIAAGSLIGYNFSENNYNMDISLADISIMAQADGEQPNTDDCVPDDNYDCIALHPTDPDKDVTKENHKWE